MRLPKLTLLLILLFNSASSQAEQRTALHLFQYGRTNTEQQERAFLDFSDLLEANMPKLSAELSQEFNIPAVSKLHLKSVINKQGKLKRPQEQNIGSDDGKKIYWKDTGALGVLTGHVRQKEDIPYVYTTFYWGTLKGAYAHEMITLQLPIVGKSFDTTYDSHSVAVLYALAHEIRQACTNTDETFYLLSEAQKRAKAVSADLPSLGSELENIINIAINKLLEDCSE